MPEMETLKLKFVLQLGGFMFVFHSNFSIACYCILQNLSVDVWSEKEKCHHSNTYSVWEADYLIPEG